MTEVLVQESTSVLVYPSSEVYSKLIGMCSCPRTRVCINLWSHIPIMQDTAMGDVLSFKPDSQSVDWGNGCSRSYIWACCHTSGKAKGPNSFHGPLSRYSHTLISSPFILTYVVNSFCLTPNEQSLMLCAIPPKSVEATSGIKYSSNCPNCRNIEEILNSRR